MKNRILLFSVALIAFILNGCEPEILKEKAYLEIKNESTAYNITGIYYDEFDFDDKNKISSNLGPGESKTFTLYMDEITLIGFKVTSDNPDALEYSKKYYDIDQFDKIKVRLTDTEWDVSYPLF